MLASVRRLFHCHDASRSRIVEKEFEQIEVDDLSLGLAQVANLLYPR